MFSEFQIQRAMSAIGYLYGNDQDQAQRAADFRKTTRGRNFMTPAVAGFYRLKAKPYVIVEISFGEFLKDDLIGCTVVDRATGEKLDDESTCLNSLDELAGFFAKLEGKFS